MQKRKKKSQLEIPPLPSPPLHSDHSPLFALGVYTLVCFWACCWRKIDMVGFAYGIKYTWQSFSCRRSLRGLLSCFSCSVWLILRWLGQASSCCSTGKDKESMFNFLLSLIIILLAFSVDFYFAYCGFLFCLFSACLYTQTFLYCTFLYCISLNLPNKI